MIPSLKKTPTAALASSIVFALVAIAMPWPPVKTFFAAAYVFLCALGAGNVWAPKDKIAFRLAVGFGVMSATIAVIGAATYGVANLGTVATAFVACVSPLFAALVGSIFAPPDDPFTTHAQHGREKRPPRRRLSAIGMSALAAAALVAQVATAGFAFSLLKHAATDAAIRSPWDAVPAAFLVLMTVLAAFTAAAAVGPFSAAFTVASAAVFAAAALAVTRFVYSIGFGFDPFIHRATETAILAHGVIAPKPFYYLGQYALTVVSARLTGQPIAAIDVRLVPYAFVAVLPIVCWALVKTLRDSMRFPAAGLIALFLFPLSAFIATTPQALANVFLFASSFTALAALTTQSVSPVLPILFALAAVSVHPITGLPLLAFTALIPLAGDGRFAKERRVARWIIAVLGAVAIPVAFAINAAVSSTSVTVDAGALRNAAAAFADAGAAGYARAYDALLDAAYFWKFCRSLVLLGAAVAGYVIIAKRHPKTRIFAAGAAIFGLNAFLLAYAVRFPFLIEYERTNYADRFVELSLLFFAPLAVVAMTELIERLRTRPTLARASLAVLLAGLLTASIYLAYPRRDAHEASRGWSTSKADINAVRSIQKDSNGAKYVVLANQSTAAAAVREFGFANYFPPADAAGDAPIFYYPIPTGERLYANFIAMNDALGSRVIAAKTMDLVGTDRMYYAVSKYWWHAQQIVVGAKREANAWWSVDGGGVYVFRYDRKK